MLTVSSRNMKESQPMSVKGVEDKIRNAAHFRCARTDEYLKDFDRLRSGYITQTQFKRCLDQHYGILLKPEEEKLIMEKYGSDRRQPGMFNYRDFCETVDAGFDPSILDKPPTTQVIGPAASIEMPKRPLSPDAESKCQEILQRIAPHYQYHGISVKTCYEDFDRHNIGIITESQFFRSFPGPPDVAESEMRLLARKYRHITKNGMCSYLLFHQDIVQIQQNLTNAKQPTEQIDFDQLDLTGKKKKENDIEDVFNKIRIAVHKNGIRTTEFFRDHDKLRSGVITRNQFVCGLSLCCGTQANLSRDEINSLVNFYQTEDGRVRYKEFCDSMENAFTVPHLEKNPTATVYRPKVGELAKVPNTLSASNEERVTALISRLRDTVQKKRLMIYPYFKDFDRGKSYTRSITKTQFSRMLHMVGLTVSQPELELLAMKFDSGGDVYYPAFIQAIDAEYVGTAMPKPEMQVSFEEKEAKNGIDANVTSAEPVDLGEVIGRIRHHVLVNRLRTEEFFQDFDPLRHGSISENRFRMGLSAMGANVTETQFQALARAYADPKRSGNVLWNEFLVDVEVVFTKRGLEKTPKYAVPPSVDFLMEKPGTVRWETVDIGKKDLLNSVLSRMQETAKQRRVLAKPCFQDFDRHNKGYVTKSQFCQCLTSLCLSASKEEMDVLIERFSDDTGFNYIAFLEVLQPSEKTDYKYTQRLKELNLVNQKSLLSTGSTDISEIMNKIKTKVVKERVRVEEFMKDYDKLRTGRLLKSVFPRAIDLCNFNLVKPEVDELMKWYETPNHPEYVDYTRFCDDVESAFTVKGLEKNPLYEVTQFHPASDSENNKLDENAETMLETVMQRLAERVRLRRIQIFPLFEDYDRVHNGSVSRSQFRRVLSELELGSLVSAREFQVIYKKFDILIGGKHDFNYIAFCDVINDYAHFEYGKP